MGKDRLKALIFDLDGTLADTEEAHRQAFNEAFAAAGLDWRWDSPLYRRLLGVAGGKERILAFAPGTPASQVADLHAEKTRRYTALMAAGKVELRPGIRDLLDEAKASGLKLGLATTTSRANIEALLAAHFPQGSPFCLILAGEDVANKKPDPEIYRIALAKLGVAAGEALAIEDSEAGLLAANGAGMACLITVNAWTEGGDFKAALSVLPSLTGVRLAGLQALLADGRGDGAPPAP
jgi:HAD superfamily hydrolase (TIGR01509 family)